MIRLLLKEGNTIEVPGAKKVNVEGDYVVCRDATLQTLLRIQTWQVTAYGSGDALNPAAGDGSQGAQHG